MQQICVECSSPNGGDLLLYRTTLVEYGDFGEYFWDGEDFEILV